jgi:hypothetical protein
MRKAQVFRFIWRANAVLILAGGLCALILVGILAVTQLRWMFRERHVDAVVNTDVSGNVDEQLTLGSATRIIGQSWLLVRLSSDQSYQQGSFSKSADAARKYAFVAPSEPTRWLYDHNRFLILDANQIPGTNYDDNDEPTALISFLVVEKDSDNNGRLTGNDDAVLVFTRPDGTGRTAVLESVHTIISEQRIGEEVLVLYEGAGGYESVAFSLKDFSQLRREKISLPGASS